jgi:orotidine-5'-phosphate decarboxylase
LRPALPASFEIVTPGIRLGGGLRGDDQRRVATPERALADGADILVVGRPLTRAADPKVVLDSLATAATK